MAHELTTPHAAATALLEVTTWLRQRGPAEPLPSWRQRDTRSDD